MGEMRPEKRPRLMGPMVASGPSDVAPPDHPGSGFGKRRGHAGCLWIVEENHVALPDPTHHAFGVGGGDLRVVGGLVRPELTGVPGRSVETVVDPLRDGEELGVGIHYEPTDVDIGVQRVADQHLEHLCHAAARSRRAHIPNRLPRQQATGPKCRLPEFPKALRADKRFETREGANGHLDLSDGVPLYCWFSLGQSQDTSTCSPLSRS